MAGEVLVGAEETFGAGTLHVGAGIFGDAGWIVAVGSDADDGVYGFSVSVQHGTEADLYANRAAFAGGDGALLTNELEIAGGTGSHVEGETGGIRKAGA